MTRDIGIIQKKSQIGLYRILSAVQEYFGLDLVNDEFA
jgi:hypothetical protein